MAGLKVEAVQSVIPAKVTEPRMRWRISISGELQSGILQKYMQVILYYKKSEEEECGLEIGGWLKESLSCALCEQPLLAGRLYKSGDGEWDLVSNDSGVRLLEAQLEMSLSQFLDWDKRRDVEHQLGYWKDIEEQDPHFSALFYVQVTNLGGEGYAVGITWSPLLADPFFMISFIKKWSSAHNKLLSQQDGAKQPLFYLPNFRRAGECITLPGSNSAGSHSHWSMVFNLAGVGTGAEQMQARWALSNHCLEEVRKKSSGVNMACKFVIIFRDIHGGGKAEACDEVVATNGYGNEISEGIWYDLGAKEVSFYKANKPILVSYLVGAFNDEGLVMIMPRPREGIPETVVCATVPINLR